MEQNQATNAAVLSGAKFTEWVKKFNHSHYNLYVRFFKPAVTAERCEEIAKKAFEEIRPKLAAAWKVLFDASYIPEIGAPKVAIEYQPMLRVKRYFGSVDYGYADKKEVDVPYGYVDYAGQAHEVFTLKETKTNYGFGWFDKIKVDQTIISDKFLCRDSDSPVFKHWVKEYLIEEQRKKGADVTYVTGERPLFWAHLTDEPSETPPEKGASYRISPLEVNNLSDIRAELAKLNVGTANFQIGEIVKKSITGHSSAFPMHLDSVPYDCYAVFAPFAFYTYEVEAHKLTVRVDMINGTTHYFIDNPFGLTDGPDKKSSRLEEFERKLDKKSGHTSSASGKGSDKSERAPVSGKSALAIAILSIFIPILMSIIGIVVGAKALKQDDGSAKTSIAAIVISIVTLLFWAIVIFGSKFIFGD